jgi:hypothetical protein
MAGLEALDADGADAAQRQLTQCSAARSAEADHGDSRLGHGASLRRRFGRAKPDCAVVGRNISAKEIVLE